MFEGVYDGITRVIERRGWGLLLFVTAIGILMLYSPWNNSPPDIPVIRRSEIVTRQGVHYQTQLGPASQSVTTSVWVLSGSAGGDTRLMARCRGGEYEVSASPVPRSIAGPTPEVRWRIDDRPELSNPPQWRLQSVGSHLGAFLREPDRLRELIADANRLTLRFEDDVDGWLELSFPVAGFFGTDVQPNLDRCGEY